MKRMNRPSRVEQRREAARKRQEVTAAMSVGDRLALIEKRPGRSDRERTRLELLLWDETEAAAEVHREQMLNEAALDLRNERRRGERVR